MRQPGSPTDAEEPAGPSSSQLPAEVLVELPTENGVAGREDLQQSTSGGAEVAGHETRRGKQSTDLGAQRGRHSTQLLERNDQRKLRWTFYIRGHLNTRMSQRNDGKVKCCSLKHVVMWMEIPSNCPRIASSTWLKMMAESCLGKEKEPVGGLWGLYPSAPRSGCWQVCDHQMGRDIQVETRKMGGPVAVCCPRIQVATAES